MKNLLYQLKKVYPKTTSVVDADNPLIFEVTKEDVRKSTRKDMNNCAIAVACKRGSSGKSPDFVVASRSRVYIITKGEAVRYTMPTNAVREITSFDRGASFTPGIYIIYPLTPAGRLGAQRGKKKRDGGRYSGEPVHHELIDNIRSTMTKV